jgi:hypothetical protein
VILNILFVLCDEMARFMAIYAWFKLVVTHRSQPCLGKWIHHASGQTLKSSFTVILHGQVGNRTHSSIHYLK